MSDYERVARLIRYLDEHGGEQPGVPRLAKVAGLSESRLHRLFQEWAGTTPKAFLQCLTWEHAKHLLRRSESVLGAAHGAGLSGAGRLHDLSLLLEAATPGEVKSGGAGLRIRWGEADSPFGCCTLAWSERGVCHLSFSDAGGGILPGLESAWPRAQICHDRAGAVRLAAGIFREGGGRGLRAHVRGTEFQIKVWRALLTIPEGSVSTYARIAGAIDHPRASRAVGAACGANPVAYLIPCHRVIRSTGIFDGYRWGTTRKQALLAYENCEKNNARNPDRPDPGH